MLWLLILSEAFRHRLEDPRLEDPRLEDPRLEEPTFEEPWLPLMKSLLGKQNISSESCS